jgi:hypothetical protein
VWFSSRTGESISQAIKEALLTSSGASSAAAVDTGAAATPSPPCFADGESLVAEFLDAFGAFVKGDLEHAQPLEKLKPLLAFACRKAFLRVVQV